MTEVIRGSANANVYQPQQTQRAQQPARPSAGNTNSAASVTPSATQNSTLSARRVQSSTTEPTGVNMTALQALSELKGKKGVDFANALDGILQDPEKRAALASQFKLDTPANKADLGRAMILEAGTGHNAENMMPVGRVILNRAIAVNAAYAVDHPKAKMPHFSISSIMNEKDQFASKGDFNAKSRNSEGSSRTTQNMVTNLLNGDTGTPEQASAFYFRRGKMDNQTFSTPDGHSFAKLYDSNINYINGNYLKTK